MTDLESALSLIGSAAETAGSVLDVTGSILSIVQAVNGEAERALKRLREDRDRIRQQRSSLLREALQDANDVGDELKRQCESIHNSWDTLSNYMRWMRASCQLEENDVMNLKGRMEDLLSKTARCQELYDQFKEKLQYALTLAIDLQDRCQQGGRDAREAAKKTKKMAIVGGVTGAAGAVALGAAAVATGGLALPLAAAFVGVGVLATGGIGAVRVRQLRKLESEFESTWRELRDSVSRLNELDNRIDHAYAMTQMAVRQMEDALAAMRSHELRFQQLPPAFTEAWQTDFAAVYNSDSDSSSHWCSDDSDSGSDTGSDSDSYRC